MLNKDETRLVIDVLRQEERRYEDNAIPYVTQSTPRELAIIKLRVKLEKKLEKKLRNSN